jgi:hypothetical protein
MATNEQEVRDLLDKPAATSVSPETVNGNINRSILFVNSIKQATATTNMVDESVKAMAVWLSYGSYMEGITRELGSISEADEVKLNHYRKVAELFLSTVSSQPVNLDNPVENAKGNDIPLDPSVFGLTITEAYGS